MNNFHVILTEIAIADLKGISKELQQQIHQDLKALESSPFPSGTKVKRLKAFRPKIIGKNYKKIKITTQKIGLS